MYSVCLFVGVFVCLFVVVNPHPSIFFSNYFYREWKRIGGWEGEGEGWVHERKRETSFGCHPHEPVGLNLQPRYMPLTGNRSETFQWVRGEALTTEKLRPGRMSSSLKVCLAQIRGNFTFALLIILFIRGNTFIHAHLQSTFVKPQVRP